MRGYPNGIQLKRVCSARTKKSQGNMLLVDDGVREMLSLQYMMFIKALAQQTDLLGFLDRKQAINKQHVEAAGRKILAKFSYSSRVRQNIDDDKENSSSDDDTANDDLEEDESEE